mmetsp:Transcript_7731/g.20323  ORF Transcript_7731/g.20323 Transcript_7731/m.20323 type:complete len:284 (+) Transcript_7731:303-1154(+)
MDGRKELVPCDLSNYRREARLVRWMHRRGRWGRLGRPAHDGRVLRHARCLARSSLNECLPQPDALAADKRVAALVARYMASSPLRRTPLAHWSRETRPRQETRSAADCQARRSPQEASPRARYAHQPGHLSRCSDDGDAWSVCRSNHRLHDRAAAWTPLGRLLAPGTSLSARGSCLRHNSRLSWGAALHAPIQRPRLFPWVQPALFLLDCTKPRRRRGRGRRADARRCWHRRLGRGAGACLRQLLDQRAPHWFATRWHQLPDRASLVPGRVARTLSRAAADCP